MTSLALFVPRDLCVLQVSPPPAAAFPSAAERVLGSFEDLSGCVTSDQMVGGVCKVELGAYHLAFPIESC